MTNDSDNRNLTEQNSEDIAAAVLANPEASSSKMAEVASPLKRKYGDPYLWGIYIFLCLVSLVITYDAAGREIRGYAVYGPLIKQFIFLFMGGTIAFFIQKIDYKRYLKFIPLFCLATFLALIYVEKFGESINGAQRHISLMGFSIQPTEMAKLAVVLIMAQIMAKNQMENGVKWRGVFICFGVVAMFGIFLVKQGLTNTLLLMAITVAMILVSGTQWRKIFTLVGVFLVLIAILFSAIVIAGYGEESSDDNLAERGVDVENIIVPTNNDVEAETPVDMNSRIINFIDYAEDVIVPVLPRFSTHAERLRRFFDPTPLYERRFCEENNQEMFASMAQASGGVAKLGIGGSQYSSMLPLAFSDYVFSIIIEDTGFVGGVFLLIMYLFILARAGIIAKKCKRAMPALMVIGLAFLIVIQALFHMAINTGVFPVSGQPLPLISMGGTSILVISVAFGIMQSVCRSACTSNDKKADIKAEFEMLPQDMRAENDAN